MKNLKIMVIGAGMLAMATVETLAKEITTADVVVIESNELEYSKPFDLSILEAPVSISLEILSDGLILAEAGGVYVAPVVVKVPIYSVPLPEENKIVLVKDPKGFVERAIRHKMEYLAIKPGDKGEYWELVPVFTNEAGALSFSLNKETEGEETGEDEELLRIVPVKDFLRYN